MLTQIDAESSSETATITAAMSSCASGQAVELSLGSTTSNNAFLINPITVPSGVSLIVDGGVTVYGTLDSANYQVPSVGSSICGVPGAHGGGCLSLLTFMGNDGLYGYGVIDGRGYASLMCSSTACSPTVGSNFWYLTTHYENPSSLPGYSSGVYAACTNDTATNGACYTQNVPILLVDSGDNFTIYKITLRNTPLWNMNLYANNITVWGLKEQTTWAVPNTDGMDLTGTNITVANSTLSGGDDAVAIGAYGAATSNVTINGITGYSRNGLSTSTALENGISNVLIENSNLTGDVPSLSGTTVNGQTPTQMSQFAGTTVSYTAALPATMGDTRGINIKNSVYGTPVGTNGNHVTNYEFGNICLQDLDSPITFGTGDPGANGIYNYPTLSNIQYNNIHVLVPTLQFAGYNGGLYTPNFRGYVGSTAPANDIHLNNVVFDDLATGARAIGDFYAEDDNFTNSGNVYPPALNLFYTKTVGGADTGYHDPAGNLYLDMNTDNTLQKSATSTPTPALSCPASNWPFLIGDLYISTGGPTASGNSTNKSSIALTAGSSITLNAMVEPATGQVEYWTGSALDTGAPALSQPVQFYESVNAVGVSVGTASLSANGTLASLTLTGLTTGSHTYYAMYPQDTYYGAYKFGSVSVQVSNAGPTTTISTPTSVTYGVTSTITVTVAGSPAPTGTVSIYDGQSLLSTQALVSGAASYSVQFTTGSHSLTATYSGDSNNPASTSSAVNVSVTLATSAITLSSSTQMTNQYKVVTFTATVPGIAMATPPTGTVSFSDSASGAQLGTQTLSNGVAAVSVPMVLTGTRTIVATYSGDGNYNSVNTSTMITVGAALAPGPPAVVGGCSVIP